MPNVSRRIVPLHSVTCSGATFANFHIIFFHKLKSKVSSKNKQNNISKLILDRRKKGNKNEA